jgi:plasmid stability protein
MATLNIRNLPDEVHKRLRMRAAKHGRSMEAEARDILAEACDSAERPQPNRKEALAKAKRLQALIDRLYGHRKPENVVDQFLAERRREALRDDLD